MFYKLICKYNKYKLNKLLNKCIRVKLCINVVEDEDFESVCLLNSLVGNYEKITRGVYKKTYYKFENVPALSEPDLRAFESFGIFSHYFVNVNENMITTQRLQFHQYPVIKVNIYVGDYRNINFKSTKFILNCIYNSIYCKYEIYSDVYWKVF